MITAHLLFWILFIVQSVFGAPPEYISQLGFADVLYKQTTFYLILAFNFYINYLYLFPKFFSNKKYWRYSIGIFVCVVFSYILYCAHGYYFEQRWNMEGMFIDRIQTPYVIIFQVFFYFLVSSGLKVFSEWRKSFQLKEALQTAELSLLKHQFSQHFLFNTLNTIYSLALKKSNDTTTAILRLSDLLRYSLKKEMNEKIPLNSDIEFITNYIDLQSMRIKSKEIISFVSSGVESHHYIYPLLVISFVENAFKHSDSLAENAKISFKIKVKDNQLMFTSVNNIGKKNDLSQSNGIGIENVKKRLEILYNNKYKLDINNDGLLFTVNLRIDLV